jgi:NAD(P)-dependent dehydrogenase (short-subunit alcohol dehydrogenase family)
MTLAREPPVLQGDLRGEVVAVTGSTQGVGEAVAGGTAQWDACGRK